jgi:hypothetical protein
MKRDPRLLLFFSAAFEMPRHKIKCKLDSFSALNEYDKFVKYYYNSNIKAREKYSVANYY